MPATTHDLHLGPGHVALLSSSPARSRAGIDTWVRSALARAEKLATVAAPADLALGHAIDGGIDHGSGGVGVTPAAGQLIALDPAELHPAAQPVELVRGVLDEGYRGLNVLVWADGVIAAASPDVHADLEAALAKLCREQPVSVLCLYDRDRAGSDHLDRAVVHHPDELRDQLVWLRRTDNTLQLGGELDATNIDVLTAALHTITTSANAARVVRIDVSQLAFLSVAAARVIARGTTAYRDQGGHVELHGATPQITKVVQLLGLDQLPGLDVIAAE